MEKKLKTAKKADNKLVPLHKQIATGNKPKRKPITK
jgi:hypothetical protein